MILRAALALFALAVLPLSSVAQAPPSQEGVLGFYRFPAVHGAPIHLGDPSQIGIADLARPDFGDAVNLHAGEITHPRVADAHERAYVPLGELLSS